MEKKGFFVSLGKRKLGVVLNLFYAYMSLGLVLIMLGAILPDLKADYALSYQVGGALLSVQSVGYVLAGLLAGYLPLLLGIKVSYILIQLSVTQQSPDEYLQRGECRSSEYTACLLCRRRCHCAPDRSGCVRLADGSDHWMCLLCGLSCIPGAGRFFRRGSREC